MKVKIFWKNLYHNGAGVLVDLESEINKFLSTLKSPQISKISHITHDNLEIVYVWYSSQEE